LFHSGLELTVAFAYASEFAANLVKTSERMQLLVKLRWEPRDRYAYRISLYGLYPVSRGLSTESFFA